MEARNLVPHHTISAYVDRILILENREFSRPFTLPLYANGVPTLLFTSVKGKLDGGTTNHLTLFGQTVVPENLTLTEDFFFNCLFFQALFFIAAFWNRRS